MNKRHANSRPDQMSLAVSLTRRTGCQAAAPECKRAEEEELASSKLQSHLSVRWAPGQQALSRQKYAGQREDPKRCQTLAMERQIEEQNLSYIKGQQIELKTHRKQTRGP